MWTGNVKVAIASLRNAKWRSILTMMGIIIGISSVVTIVSLGEGLKSQVVGQINQLGSDVITIRPGKVANKNEAGNVSGVNLLAFLNASTLTQKDITSIGKLPSVANVAPIAFVTNSVSSTSGELNSASVIGTTGDLQNLLRQKLAYGGFFDNSDANANFAVIGSSVAHKLFKQLNPVGHSLTINGQAFIVHGVLSQGSGGLISVGETDYNSGVFIPFEQAKILTNNQTNLLQILVKGKGNINATIADVHQTLFSNHNQKEDFSVLNQEELLKIVSGIFGTLTGFISGIAAISLLVGGIGIMDIMLVSVSERTREIGIRKAVGATNRQILNQFLIEGLALTIVGGLIGVIVSLIINLLLHLYTDYQPVINIPIVVLAVLVSVLVGVVFSAAPALKAARKDPMTALRGD